MTDELVAATRALLAQPLIDRSSPTSLALVRRHRVELTRWFADEMGYRLDASRPGVARLAKLPGPGHAPRGLRTRQGRPFDGRRYAIVCLVLASAEAAGERCTLAQMFDDVAARAAGVEGLVFDTDVGADRRVFIQAVQAVAGLGVLERAEGDEEGFARGIAGGDALYRVDRERLALLPTAPQPPSLAGSPRDVGFEPYPDTEAGRARRRRHRVTRALAEQPVVYQGDLTDDEHDYLRSQRGRLQRLLADRVGLTLEVRAEGWVAVDEAGDLTDLRWPDYGAAETTALRLCDELRHRRGRDEPPVWPFDELAGYVRGLADEYAGYWRKDAATEAGALDLAERAVGILVAARLVRRTEAGVVALPAAGRYAAARAPSHTTAPQEALL
jgi:uncharacterized protein (TIGR02678 family)